MDHSLFDDLTRSVASSTSRRQALKLMTASLAGGLFLGTRNVCGDTTPATPKSAAGNALLIRPSGAAVSNDSDVGPNTFELLSYQGSRYTFQIIPLGATPPPGFEQPDFDDSGFSGGNAAFGSGGGCPLQSTVQTSWPVNSQLLVRRVISIRAPAGVSGIRIMLSVDNDIIGVFFNGVQIALPSTHEGCSALDEFQVNVPQSLVKSGENLVAFHVLDRGFESFFDARILAEVTEGALTQALDEITTTVDRLAPIVPVSNITVACLSADTPNESSSKVSFLIDETGQTAELRVIQRRKESTSTTTLDYFIDRTLVATTRGTIGQNLTGNGQPLVGVDTTIQRLPNVTNRPRIALAFSSVLARPPVTRDLLACLIAKGEPESCVNACALQELIYELISDGTTLAMAVWIGPEVEMVSELMGMGLAQYSLRARIARKGQRCRQCCDTGCDKELCLQNRKAMGIDPHVCQQFEQ